MALDLVCYWARPSGEAERIRSTIASKLESQYGAGLVHYRVKAASELDQEIASEFGLRAASKFLISVNDKEAMAPELRAVATAVKDGFGADDVCRLAQ